MSKKTSSGLSQRVPQGEPERLEGEWSRRSHRERCRIVANVRRRIAAMAEMFIEACENDQRTDPVETITAELMPLCEALKFIGRRGPSLLRPRRVGIWGRPIWHWGIHSEVRREPLGDVLILAAWNYPLLLPGVQMAQALAAGNRVWIKPAPGCETATALLVTAFLAAGIPTDTLWFLPSAPQAARDRMEQGVDLVVLTGSSQTGRSVMTRCAQTLTPSIMELSGCDALIVGPGADLKLVADAVAFGLTFNAGATCIGPRRIIVHPSQHRELVAALRHRLVDTAAQSLHASARGPVAAAIADAFARGGRDVIAPQTRKTSAIEDGSMRPLIMDGVAADWPIAAADLFAPVASILRSSDHEETVAMVNRCKYRLAASLFGDPQWAEALAARLDVGHVSINDLIFPTADPRVPFGGCGESGFGVTRGAEGLLAMTRPKVIARHRGRLFLHLQPRHESDAARMLRALQAAHGGSPRR